MFRFFQVVFEAAYWQTYYDLHQKWFVDQLLKYLVMGVQSAFLAPLLRWLLTQVERISGKIPQHILEWFGIDPGGIGGGN